MHGRKRTTAPLPLEQQAAVKAKLETYRTLSRAAMQARAEGASSPEAFALNGKLVGANPDVLSLWNHRREMLLTFEAGADDARLRALLSVELLVTAAGIGRNPKSYPAWHHRAWAVAHFHPLPGGGGGGGGATVDLVPGRVDVRAELALCATLLDADERNFHCWNYRGWLAKAARVPPTEELEYTAHRIEKNFSNYSAWQARSHLLGVVHGVGVEEGGARAVPVLVLAAELTILRQAVFTEPDDQSPWFYRRWVVAQLESCWGGGSGRREDAPAAVKAVLEDLRALRELSALEPSAKWPLIALAHGVSALQTGGARALLHSGALDAAGVEVEEGERAGMLSGGGGGMGRPRPLHLAG